MEMKGPPASLEEQTPLSDDRVRQVLPGFVTVMLCQAFEGRLFLTAQKTAQIFL